MILQWGYVFPSLLVIFHKQRTEGYVRAGYQAQRGMVGRVQILSTRSVTPVAAAIRDMFTHESIVCRPEKYIIAFCSFIV